MKIECVTVCVGYADFLAETLPWNLPLFERLVVVTSPDDRDTFEVCRRRSVHCLTTEDFYRDNLPFNKGRGVQRGIDALSCADWVVHLDADTVLPPSFRQAFASADPDPACLYGCDRVMVTGWEAWQRLKRSAHLQHDYHCRVNAPDGFPLGTRWASPMHGYVPIGFFQCWHGATAIRQGYHHRPYPAHHGDAARSDVQFALQWDRRRRLLLPEVIAWHLESEPSKLGRNWNGRKSAPFGPSKSEPSPPRSYP